MIAPILYEHFCAARGCNESIDLERLMCVKHMEMVPRELRNQLFDAKVAAFHRHAKIDDKVEFFKIRRQVLDAVQAQEGRTR